MSIFPTVVAAAAAAVTAETVIIAENPLGKESAEVAAKNAAVAEAAEVAVEAERNDLLHQRQIQQENLYVQTLCKDLFKDFVQYFCKTDLNCFSFSFLFSELCLCSRCFQLLGPVTWSSSSRKLARSWRPRP